jgi:AcrR family transcriptional regulator
MSLVKLTCPIKKALHAKRERRKEARPGELLEAALDLFVEKGFTATRVEEVAARAGVSKGTLFLYFPSKEELFKAVVRQNISSHFKEWDETFDNFKGTSAEMISLCAKEWWRRVGATKASGIKKLMLSEAGNFPDLAVFYRQEVVEPGQLLIRRGEFRDIDLDYAVFSIISPMIFLMLAKHSADACVSDQASMDPEKFIASQLQIILYGMSQAPLQNKSLQKETKE